EGDPGGVEVQRAAGLRNRTGVGQRPGQVDVARQGQGAGVSQGVAAGVDGAAGPLEHAAGEVGGGPAGANVQGAAGELNRAAARAGVAAGKGLAEAAGQVEHSAAADGKVLAGVRAVAQRQRTAQNLDDPPGRVVEGDIPVQGRGAGAGRLLERAG